MAETKTLTGGCLCGRVRYTVTGAPMMVAQCHCTDCQKATGTGHLTAAAFPSDAVKVTGELKSYSMNGDSGKPVERLFCPNCGSLIMGKPHVMPNMTTITLGTLDDPDAVGPIGVAVFAKRKRVWDPIDPSIQAFETFPPRPPG
jgi:hypothetical protein